MLISQSIQMVEPPRGMYSAFCDKDGRMKLPVDFQTFLNALAEKKLFCTSFDRKSARIYPMPKWREVEELLEKYREDPDAVRKLAFNASDLGGESVMDRQGRIQLPPELRRELNLEAQNVRVRANRGHIEVLNQGTYEEMKNEARQVTREDLNKLEMAGLI
jgi:MraZ protein